ncbi:MAG TPA: LON peptidase substrate-binding domain-containing protein [Alphaproteobacteria bacterium]
MEGGPFDPTFEELPRQIPIFPLTGVLLLPRGRLPLNIFEPRYLAMTRDALAGPRLIGMIQPERASDAGGDQPPVFRTGCAGRIIQFGETPDGRYLITLTGLIRFDVGSELPPKDGYRRIMPVYAPYRADLERAAPGQVDRARLLAALKRFFERRQIGADWSAIEQAADEQLVTVLAMMCPFHPGEKQALLEAPDLARRCATMIALLEMSVAEDGAQHLPQ